jgi:hypothetical protein
MAKTVLAGVHPGGVLRLGSAFAGGSRSKPNCGRMRVAQIRGPNPMTTDGHTRALSLFTLSSAVLLGRCLEWVLLAGMDGSSCRSPAVLLSLFLVPREPLENIGDSL